MRTEFEYAYGGRDRIPEGDRPEIEAAFLRRSTLTNHSTISFIVHGCKYSAFSLQGIVAIHKIVSRSWTNLTLMEKIKREIP